MESEYQRGTKFTFGVKIGNEEDRENLDPELEHDFMDRLITQDNQTSFRPFSLDLN